MDRNIQQAWSTIPFDNIKELKDLVPNHVSSNSSTNSIENHLHTLLMCSAAHGSIQCCKYLLENKANPNKKNFIGFTALHWAAFTCRIECVEELLKFGAKLESKTEDGKTPLHIAASRGHLQFIKYIINFGANINAVSSEGWNAIHYALIGNHQNVVKFLLDNNVDYLSLDINGNNIKLLIEEYGRNWFYNLKKIND